MSRRKVMPYDFIINLPKLNTTKFRCCNNYIIKFGMREQWYCKECKNVYELNLVKVNRYLKQIDLDYLDEVMKENE